MSFERFQFSHLPLAATANGIAHWAPGSEQYSIETTEPRVVVGCRQIWCCRQAGRPTMTQDQPADHVATINTARTGTRAQWYRG